MKVDDYLAEDGEHSDGTIADCALTVTVVLVDRQNDPIPALPRDTLLVQIKWRRHSSHGMK